MATSEGMVAVVRGLGDQGISVTLMDGNQQFTLVPNNAAQTANNQPKTGVQMKNNQQQQYEPNNYQGCPGYHGCCCRPYSSPAKQVNNAGCSTEEVSFRKDFAVQANDGRYASTYKMTHCHVAPTSPEHHQVTEFPPQRPNHYPGHGNFMVGGTGSGEANHSPTRTSAFRGAMCWSDRGAVFSPRPSRQVDSFANSLRQYPANISPDRSAEIVERLINYTQAKNFNKNSSNNSSAFSARVASANTKPNKTFTAAQQTRSPYDDRIGYKNKAMEQKPTREVKDKRDVFQRNYDVKFIRNYSLYQQLTAPPPTKSIDTKNTEIQAAAIKLSKYPVPSTVSTPEKRSVAIQLATISSSSKSSSAKTYSIKSAQTSVSLLDINSTSDVSLRRSQSYEIIISDSAEKFRLEILDWFKNVSLIPSKDPNERSIRHNLLKRLKTKLDNAAMKSQAQSVKAICDNRAKEIDRISQNTRHTNVDNNLREATVKKSSNGAKVVNLYQNNARLLITEILNVNDISSNEFEEAIAYWLETVIINPVDRNIMLSELVKRLKPIVEQKHKNMDAYKSLLKGEIIDFLDEKPLKLDGSSKTVYKHRIADLLIRTLISLPGYNTNPQVLDSEVRNFVRSEIQKYLQMNYIEMNPNHYYHIESDLTDILLEALIDICANKTDEVEEDISYLLQENFELNEKDASETAKGVVIKFKEHLHLRNCEEIEIKSVKSALVNSSKTFLVYQSKSQDTVKSKQVINSTVNEVSSGTVTEMVDKYVKDITEQINIWLSELSIGVLEKDKKQRKAAICDLAADIVDRKRYSEINSSIITEEEELEHLKYQIFKWINKFVSDDNRNTISHAPELLRRIQSIPVPMLSKPVQNPSNPIPTEPSISTNPVNELDINIDVVIKEVKTWLQDVPAESIINRDLGKSVKDFADVINKKLKAKPKNPAELIDKQVMDLCKRVLKDKNLVLIDDLKLRIKKCLLKEEDYLKPDPRLIKHVIRNLEDLIDEWLETFPEPILRHKNLIGNRYKLVHELSVKLADERSKGTQNKYHDDIVNWISKLPNQPKDKKAFRQQFADVLVQMIKETNLEKSISSDHKQNTNEFEESQVEGAIVEWLKSTPFYRESNDVEKREQEQVMKNLAKAINSLKDETMVQDVEEKLSNEIIKHIKMLPLSKSTHGESQNEDFIEETSMQLKAYIQRQLFYQDLTNRDPDEFLKANVSMWMDELPLLTEDLSNKEEKQKYFIESLKRMRASCSSDSVIGTEILRFLNTLAMDCEKLCDKRFLEKETEKLRLKLRVIPISDVRRNASVGILLNGKQNTISNDTIRESSKKQNGTKNSQVSKVDSSDSENTYDDITLNSSSEQESQTSKVNASDQSEEEIKVNLPMASSTAKEFHKTEIKGPEASFNASNISHQETPMMYLKEWIDELPADNKDNLFSKIKRKIEIVRSNPDAMYNQFLFEDMLENEIDSVLDDLKQTSALTRRRHELKVKLIALVTDENKKINEIAAQNYRQQLKECLTNTLPDDLNTSADRKALEELAKDDFVDNFININFKGNDDFQKLVYKDRIMDEIKKVIEEFTQNNKGKANNAKKLQEKLYNAMYNVPIPTKDELGNLIKEIAMKQEISDWFEDLPVIQINTPEEKLERNRRKSFLAKKIIEIERFSDEPEAMIKDEIYHWLEHAPLKSQQNKPFHVEELADRIRKNDQITFVRSKEKKRSVEFKDVGYNTFSDHIPLNSSEIVHPKLQEKGFQTSSSWGTPDSKPNNKELANTSTSSQSFIKPCCKSRTEFQEEPKKVSQSTQSNNLKLQRKRVKKSSDLLYDTVTSWCNQLPIKGKDENTTRLDLTSKLILQLGEIMRNTEILGDRFLFDTCVDNALEEVLEELPDIDPCRIKCLKKVFIEQLREVRELAKNEQEAHNFRNEIYDTITKATPLPCNPFAVDEYKEKLADLLVEINLNPTMDKSLLSEEIGKCLSASIRCANKAQIKDQLYKALLKIRPPAKEALQDQMDEIKIKNEIALWMIDLPLKDNEEDQTRKIKIILAKRLHEIERNSDPHSCDYNDKMNKEVAKWLRKVISKSEKDQVLELSKDLVDRMKETADERALSQDFRDEESFHSCSACRSETFKGQNDRNKRYRCKCSSKSKCKKRNNPNIWDGSGNRYPKCFVPLYPCFFR